MAEVLTALDQARAFNGAGQDLQLDMNLVASQALYGLSQTKEAETLLRAVARQASDAHDRFREALALTSLGWNHLDQRKFDEALPFFERVLSFNDLEPLIVYSRALNNAGICYARLGQFDRAVRVQERVVRMNEKQGPSVSLEEALGELGDTHLQQADPKRAIPYLQKALALATDPMLKEDARATADAATWIDDLAVAYSELHDWTQAERFNDESRNLKVAAHAGAFAFKGTVLNTLTAAQIAQGRGQLEKARLLFEEALATTGVPTHIKWGAYAGLGNLAALQKRPDQAVRRFEAAVDLIERSRSQLLRTDDRLSYLSALIRVYHDYVDVLVDHGQIGRAIEVADSSRARVLADRQSAALPARGSAASFRRAAAQTHHSLLFYWLSTPRSYLWIVSGNAVRCIPLPPAREIEDLVREYQRTIASSTSDPLAASDTAGDRLYRMLVQPAEPWIGTRSGTARVVIVPDGALHGLSFETLPVDGSRRHYWIEDVEVEIAPSLAMLTAQASGGARQASSERPGRNNRGDGESVLEHGESVFEPRQSVLLMGNPAKADPEFPPLRFAADEMNRVARHFAADKVVTVQSDRATPSAYRDSHPERFGMVHFTAHAVANLYSPLDSAVILAQGSAGYKLYARDVSTQPLRADLVTVSACRSAGERAYAGEGLIGFAWAFLRAGARRVIAGLWDVDDQSTAELMDSLYRGISAGQSPAAALRRAKLSLMRKGGNFAKPYYWGPFELFTVSP